jgi:hypothetical protein
MKKQAKHEWRPVTVKDEKDVWVDFRCGNYVVAQGFAADDDNAWSLFHNGKWISDHAKIGEAKARAEEMIEGA